MYFQVFPGHFYFMRGHSLVELTEYDDSAADTMVHSLYIYVCCVAIPFILGIRLVDAPAGVTQKEDHTGFLPLPSAVLAFTFIARRVQPSLSLVDC